MGRFVVCYDMADDRRRRKIAEILDGYGDRVQGSVFELVVDPQTMDICLSQITAIIDRSEDSVAVYRLCRTCDRTRSYLGLGETSARIGEETVFIV